MTTPARTFVAACASAALCACQAQAISQAPPAAASAPVDFEVIHASATCGTQEPSVVRTGHEGRLKQILEADAPAASGVMRPRAPGALVLRISMGEQTSAGARLEVTAVRTDAAGGSLIVETVWQPPPSGGMNAAVMTRPCVMVRLAPGPYRSVQVIDAQGRERATTTLRG